MKEAIAKVKAAIAPKDLASHLSHYLVKGKFILASDNRIVAAAPFPLAGDFFVPGGEFEAMAGRFGEKTKVEVTPTTVIFTDGKMKATLRTLPLDLVQYDKPAGKSRKPPEGFLSALARVRPFISDNAVHFWALGVCLEKDSIFATNNICVVEAECKGLNGQGRILPCWAVDYLLGRAEELVGILASDNSITFTWDDGSWMTAKLIEGKFPEGAEKLVLNLAKPTFALTEEWRTAYHTVAEMSDHLIEFHADKMVGLTSHGEIEVIMATPAPPDGVSKWNTKFLTTVVDCATHLQPDAWPKPSPFIGSGLRGLIVGRT